MQDLRAEFPFFVENPGLCYLDSAATSLKPKAVIDALVRYNRAESVNVHRGVYSLSQKATETVEAVRAQVVDFTLAKRENTAIFVRGTTEGINLLAHILTSPESELAPFFTSFASPKKPAILLSEAEHHANIVPWQIVARRHGYALFYLPVNKEGELQISKAWLETILATHALRIIALSLQSNVTGIIHDLAPLRAVAHEQGSIFIVDAAQAIVHARTELRQLAPDFVVFSGHKIFGSTGVGAVIGPKPVLDACTVYQGGGAMISLVEKEQSQYLEAPARFEAGTLPIGEIYALGAALDFAKKHEQAIVENDAELTAYADECLRRNNIGFFGDNTTRRSAIYSLRLDGIHAHDIGTLLDEQGIAIRAGHHCCQILMRALGVTATARASFSVYNSRDDVDRLVEGLRYVRKIFRKSA
ncbi:MAG: aminotransferase class V-fold PLP-dependent enzyme [Turneriella sp.]|nr:aminotransferase class V-fold PLP-dependent enzyme [Turneriella sp.]